MSYLSASIARKICRSCCLICKSSTPLCCRMSSKCGEKEKSKCSKISFICGKPEFQGKKPKPIQVKKQFKSMWLNPFCDEEQAYCPFNPRFDDIYYVESDKAARKYWQTWVACPPIEIKPKKICCHVKAKQPPLKRRNLKAKPRTACVVKDICPEPASISCPLLKRRCHRKGRIPPKCVIPTIPSECSKPLTPYPSFSECHRLKPEARPLSECVCWRKPMLCEAWVEFRRRDRQKKLK